MNEKVTKVPGPLPAAAGYSVGSCAVMFGALAVGTDFFDVGTVQYGLLVLPVLGAVMGAALVGMAVRSTGKRFPWRSVVVGWLLVLSLTALTAVMHSPESKPAKPITPPADVTA